MKRWKGVLVAAVVALLLTVITRIAFVNDPQRNDCIPTSIPFVLQLKEVVVDERNWELPAPLFGGEAGPVFLSLGNAYMKSFDEVSDEVGYPEEYLAFDSQDTVKLLFVPMTISNEGPEPIFVDLYSLEVHIGTIPQGFASWLTDRYIDPDEGGYEIDSGETRTILTVYRVLRDGFTDEAWASIDQGPFELVAQVGSNKYTAPLKLSEESA